MAGDEAVFTIKEWLGRIDQKQDKLDEKLDAALERLDRKADQADFVDLRERVRIAELDATNRLALWERLSKQVEKNTDSIEAKSDKADVTALWRVLAGALSGAAVAILAWALTVFGGIGHA